MQWPNRQSRCSKHIQDYVVVLGVRTCDVFLCLLWCRSRILWRGAQICECWRRDKLGGGGGGGGPGTCSPGKVLKSRIHQLLPIVSICFIVPVVSGLLLLLLLRHLSVAQVFTEKNEPANTIVAFFQCSVHILYLFDCFLQTHIRLHNNLSTAENRIRSMQTTNHSFHLKTTAVIIDWRSCFCMCPTLLVYKYLKN